MTGPDDQPETATAELLPAIPEQANGQLAPAGTDPATAAVLDALDRAAQRHLDDIRPRKTRDSYARDWALWQEFHDWLAERTGHRLPDTALTPGTMTAFVTWLDEIKQAAPNSIDRRITGVTVEARRRHKLEVPKAATVAARQALKPLKLDPARQARGRGQAVASTPADLRAMNTANRTVPAPADSRRRRREYELPDLARLRDRALVTLSFGIAGRASEVSALTVEGIALESEGLRVTVPSVKGRPGRTVVVAYGRHPDSCPVRCWLAWKETADLTSGPAFRPVDQWGNLGAGRLSPDGCRIVITRAAERAGLDARLTGHSQRAGLITTGRKQGKRPEKLRAQSGHAENSPVFWRYVRDGEAWEDAATDGIGL
jgi:integrase